MTYFSIQNSFHWGLEIWYRLLDTSLILCVVFPYITTFRFYFIFHEVFLTEKKVCYWGPDIIIVQTEPLNWLLSVSDSCENWRQEDQWAKGVSIPPGISCDGLLTPRSNYKDVSLDFLQPGPATWRWPACGKEPDTQRKAGRELERERAKDLQASGSSSL